MPFIRTDFGKTKAVQGKERFQNIVHKTAVEDFLKLLLLNPKYEQNIPAKLLYEIGPRGPQIRKSLFRQNDFSLTLIKLVYNLTRKTLKSNSLGSEYLYVSSKSDITLSPGPKYFIFGDQFYMKNAKNLRFHAFLHFHARKYKML